MLLRNYLCPGYAACFLTLGIFVPRNFDMHQERTKKASGGQQKVTCRHLLSLLCAAGSEHISIQPDTHASDFLVDNGQRFFV